VRWDRLGAENLKELGSLTGLGPIGSLFDNHSQPPQHFLRC
jgi:hypothetical protein